MRSEKHRAFIRSLPCLVCSDDTGSDACHVRYSDCSRRQDQYRHFGPKPGDEYTVPMCRTPSYDAAQRVRNGILEGIGLDPLMIALQTILSSLVTTLWPAASYANISTTPCGASRFTIQNGYDRSATLRVIPHCGKGAGRARSRRQSFRGNQERQFQPDGGTKATSLSPAEHKARGTAQWFQYPHHMITARRDADLKQVEVKWIEMQFKEQQSEEYNNRSERRL